MRWLIRFTAILVFTTFPSAAETVHVTREPGAIDCPPEEVLAARVRDLRSAPDQHVDMIAEVRFTLHASGRYAASIRTIGTLAGTRTLTLAEPGCSALAAAVATSLAILFDRGAAESPKSNRADVEPIAPGAAPFGPQLAQEALSAQAEEPLQKPPQPPDPPPSLERTEVGNAPHSSSASPSSVPSSAPGTVPAGHQAGDNRVERDSWLELTAAVGPSSGLPYGLGVAFVPAFTIVLPDGIRIRLGGLLSQARAVEWGAGHTDVRLVMADWEVCAAFPLLHSGARLSVCPAVAYGSVFGSAHGYTTDYGERRQAYVAVGGAVRVGGPLLGRWGWELGSQVLGRTQVAGFSVVDNNLVSSVYELPKWGFWCGLGVGVRIW